MCDLNALELPTVVVVLPGDRLAPGYTTYVYVRACTALVRAYVSGVYAYVRAFAFVFASLCV